MEASASRENILERVRTATQANAKSSDELARSYTSLQRKYFHEGRMTRADLAMLMILRLREYDAAVVETTPDELSAAIKAQLAASGKRTFVAPAGLPMAGTPQEEFEWKIDQKLTSAEIDASEGVVTGAFCGIAESGTIVLHHSRMEGRRILTLLPDWHLCILYASQVVETLPEYFSLCEQPPVLATYISGPSATADIEMTRIKGVHGPRSLTTIMVLDR